MLCVHRICTHSTDRTRPPPRTRFCAAARPPLGRRFAPPPPTPPRPASAPPPRPTAVDPSSPCICAAASSRLSNAADSSPRLSAAAVSSSPHLSAAASPRLSASAVSSSPDPPPSRRSHAQTQHVAVPRPAAPPFSRAAGPPSLHHRILQAPRRRQAQVTQASAPRDAAVSPTLASPEAHGAGAGGDAPPISEAHDMAAIRPPPKLSEFYDFFSFSHLTPPVHFIKRKERNGASQKGDYFELEVKVCNGKLLHIVASVKGFFLVGKPHTVSHSLVDMLQQHSSVFANVSNRELYMFITYALFSYHYAHIRF